jgi:uncharacterized Zn finger protein
VFCEKGRVRIELTCNVCGKNRFAFPAGGGDDAIVACEECGHVVGSMGDLKQAFAEAVITRTPSPPIASKVKG